MAVTERTMYDLKCDWEGCDLSLSEQSDEVYNDEGSAYDDARDREWYIGDVGSTYGAGPHYCDNHGIEWCVGKACHELRLDAKERQDGRTLCDSCWAQEEEKK